jgi:hypothetical protein
MFCSQCGTRATDALAHFCKTCGAPLGVATDTPFGFATDTPVRPAAAPRPPAQHPAQSPAAVGRAPRIAILVTFGVAIVAVGFALGYFSVSKLLTG